MAFTKVETAGINSTGSLNLNGPVLIGSAASTGTASQTLQVTGGGYVSGSVGIGTTNPSRKLEVWSDTSTTSPSNGTGVSVFANLSTTDNNYSSIVFVSTDTTNVGRHGAAIGLLKDGTWTGGSGNYPGHLTFWTRPGGGDEVERLRITSSGNIGIGITNPTWKTQIHGNIDGGTNNLLITNSSTGTGAYAIMGLTAGGTGASVYLFANSQNRTADGGTSAATLRNDTGIMRLMGAAGSGITVDSSGRVLMESQVYVYATSGTRSGTPNPVSPPHYPFTTYSESYDVGSNFNASTGVFTAPVTGKYLIMATWSQSANAGRTIGTLSFNGNYEEWAESNNSYDDETGSRIRVLAANDTISFGSSSVDLNSVAISIWLLG